MRGLSAVISLPLDHLETLKRPSLLFDSFHAISADDLSSRDIPPDARAEIDFLISSGVLSQVSRPADVQLTNRGTEVLDEGKNWATDRLLRLAEPIFDSFHADEFEPSSSNSSQLVWY